MMLIVVLSLILFSKIISIQSTVYSLTNNPIFRRSTSQMSGWNAAFNCCASNNITMAGFETANKYAFVLSSFVINTGLLIGLRSDVFPTFYWISNIPFNFSMWSTVWSEPTGAGCVRTQNDAQHQWRSLICTYTEYVLCEPSYYFGYWIIRINDIARFIKDPYKRNFAILNTIIATNQIHCAGYCFRYSTCLAFNYTQITSTCLLGLNFE